MPWLSIILALLSFFAAKANGASDTKALLTAGLVGAGSYYVTHETDWGKANLGDLDGLGTTTTTVGADGQTTTSIINGTRDVLKSWGPTGTAGVIATGAAASGGVFSSSNLPLLLLGAGVLLVILK